MIDIPDPVVLTEEQLLAAFAGGQPEQLSARNLIATMFSSAQNILLSKSSQPVEHTGTTDETAILDFNIPANSLLPGDQLIIEALFNISGLGATGYVSGNLNDEAGRVSFNLFYADLTSAADKSFVVQCIFQVSENGDLYGIDNSSGTTFGGLGISHDIVKNTSTDTKINSDDIPVRFFAALDDVAYVISKVYHRIHIVRD